MAKAFIYSLACPYTKKIKYIGKTTHSLSQRLNNHNTNANARVSRWAKKLFTRKKKPIIEIIDVVNRSEVNYWERYWIHQFMAWGFNLLNFTHANVSSKVRMKFKVIKNSIVRDLRIKNPTLEEYMYVANLAEENKRSIPNQLQVMIREVMEYHSNNPNSEFYIKPQQQ
jgi:hypothetical protein